MLKRFLAWIGSLMRRRHFIASRTVVPPPPDSRNGNGALDFQPARKQRLTRASGGYLTWLR
jgi:hypothetical protein